MRDIKNQKKTGKGEKKTPGPTCLGGKKKAFFLMKFLLGGFFGALSFKSLKNLNTLAFLKISFF